MADACRWQCVWHSVRGSSHDRSGAPNQDAIRIVRAPAAEHVSGMVLSDGLAIGVGKLLGARLPERLVKLGAACIFFAFGLFGAVRGGTDLPPLAWVLGAFAMAALAFVFFRKPSGPKDEAG